MLRSETNLNPPYGLDQSSSSVLKVRLIVEESNEGGIEDEKENAELSIDDNKEELATPFLSLMILLLLRNELGNSRRGLHSSIDGFLFLGSLVLLPGRVEGVMRGRLAIGFATTRFFSGVPTEATDSGAFVTMMESGVMNEELEALASGGGVMASRVVEETP